jgi:hypothetical protein
VSKFTPRIKRVSPLVAALLDAPQISKDITLDESDKTHKGTSESRNDRLVRASVVGGWGGAWDWGDLWGRSAGGWLRAAGRWLGATLSRLRWHHRGWARDDRDSCLRHSWLWDSWLWDSWLRDGWLRSSWHSGVGSQSVNVGLGDAVGLGDNDGVGVGHRDNDGGVGRDGGLEGDRAGGRGDDLGGLVGGGDGGCVVNNGSWDLGDDGGVRGLGESHWGAADGRDDGVWARNGLSDQVDLSHCHSGWLGGNDIGDRGGDLDGDDGGGRVDHSDDLAGLGDGLGDWAQRGGVLGLNRGGGGGRVGALDGDWDGVVNHRGDSRGRGVSDDLGGAMLSPGKFIRISAIPSPRGKMQWH